jgi:ribulose-5-phosphate 4-epimerase/fuculose-1-phosphate aldolase
MAGHASLRELVATACRILDHEGHEHFNLGHVSVRLPDGEGILVKPSGLGLQEVWPDDLVVADLEGHKVQGERGLHHEMPIHTEIYRRRPDVQCVVHTHPLHAAAFSAAAEQFQMVSQDSVLFAAGVARYASARLVVTPGQGRELAEALGERSVVVLKNHGLAVVGPTVQDATFLAVSFERSLRVQLLARQFGAVDPIPPDEVEAMADYFENSYAGRVESAWQYLCRKLASAGQRAS